MMSSLPSSSIAPVSSGGNPCAQGTSRINANTNNLNSSLPWRVGD